MNYRCSEFKFKSAAEGENIYTRLYEPVENPRAVLQIVHGMAEHSALYDEFCRYLAEYGCTVVMDDHLGHGRSVSAGGEFGCFFQGGINNLIKDEESLKDIMAARHPGVPYFMMGHGMGSLIVREYMARHGEELAGAILMGTAPARNPLSWAVEKAALSSVIARKGPNAKDSKVSERALAHCVKAFSGEPDQWITGDAGELDKYRKDPMCGFSMTAAAYKSIGELQNSVNSKKWLDRIPKKLPILMVSGAEDPVGGMGIGVRKVDSDLVKSEHDVDLMLYPGARHSLIIEKNREKVFGDIRNFIEFKIIRFRKKK